MAKKHQRAQDTGTVIGAGCGSILGIAMIFGAVSAFNFLSSCGELPPPSPEQVAEWDRKIADDQRKASEFERSQKPLWAKPASTLTSKALSGEIAKCQSDIQAMETKSPYAMAFAPPDIPAQLKRVSGGLPAEVTFQQKQEFPAKVMLASYHCHFKGAGYERFSKDGSPQFMDNYIPM